LTGLGNEIQFRPDIAHGEPAQKFEKPRIKDISLEIIWLSEKYYQAEIQDVIMDGTTVKIYSIENTLADCFKFRNKIGLDVTIDALKRYFEQPSHQQDLNALIKYARVNRVEKIITPYMLALK
jgi:hypothetical protein